MPTENSKTQGTPLTRKDRRLIRREVVAAAEQTGGRAYQFAWDRNQKVQITGFPNGDAAIEPVTDNGLSIELRAPLLEDGRVEKLATSLRVLGVPARYAGLVAVVLVVGAEVLRVVA